MSFLEELHERNMVHTISDEPGLYKYLETGRRRAYIGFDPTSDSLTVGNLLPIMTLRIFQRCGHQPVVVCGGGTGLIGDPSGKSLERPLLTEERVAANVESQKKIYAKFLDFDAGAIMVNNLEWLGPLGYLQALRDIGKHMSAFSMFSKETVRARQDEGGGMSYAEFSYQLLQSYDFAFLHANYDVGMQMGGSDQWGNISSGLELIRRMGLSKAPAFGVTSPLLVDKEGNKIGKSELGAVWLSEDKTSPYLLFQYYMTLDDDAARALLPRIGDLSLEETRDVLSEFHRNPASRLAQRMMARGIVSLLYGDETAASCEAASRIIFGGDIRTLSEPELDVAFAHIPKKSLPRTMLEAPVDAIEIVFLGGISSSKSDARRLIDSSGIYLNGTPLVDGQNITTADLMHGRYLLFRKGTRTWTVVRFE